MSPLLPAEPRPRHPYRMLVGWFLLPLLFLLLIEMLDIPELVVRWLSR